MYYCMYKKEYINKKSGIVPPKFEKKIFFTHFKGTLSPDLQKHFMWLHDFYDFESKSYKSCIWLVKIT